MAVGTGTARAPTRLHHHDALPDTVDLGDPDPASLTTTAPAAR